MNQSLTDAAGTGRHTERFPAPFVALTLGTVVGFLPAMLPQGLAFESLSIGWIVPFVVCGLAALGQFERLRFPFLIWLPWTCWVLYYAAEAEADHALQRSVMMLIPIVVGMGFSTLRAQDGLVESWRRLFRWFIPIFLLSAGTTTGLLTRHGLYAMSGFAAGSITASLLACWYAAKYVAQQDKRALVVWALLAAIPVLANTRTAMVAVAVTLPLTLVPWSMAKRLAFVGLLAIAGILVFQTERVQDKMFASGAGSMEDAAASTIAMLRGVHNGTEDFMASGRAAMNVVLTRGVEDAYWFGHGANTSEEISLAIALVSHPHNDWLRLRYEYGTLGMLLFAVTMLTQMIHSWHLARFTDMDSAIFFYVGAAAFIPMTLFMFTDNVILYVAWFGNIQFAMLGTGYALLADYDQVATEQG